jgi:hypothetical protein
MTRPRKRRLPHLLAALSIAASGPASAWVYPEHRDIAVLGVTTLDAERRAAFDRLWQEARAGEEQRLCRHGADAEQSLAPDCIDWAAFAAIAGDHSCSAQGMLETVLGTPWILTVADVGAQLKVDLSQIAVSATPEQARATNNLITDNRRRIEAEAVRAKRLNALRVSDSRLQRADPQYATRAGSNNAHFLTPRPSTETSADDYIDLTLKKDSEISAMGVYAWYHLSALQKATRLANEQLPTEERRALARAMLADEAFALHFLQDIFAAGHVAGTWGDASQRKGTHDYYNEAGLEVFLWEGSSDSMVLMGDAHMRPEDAKRAAVAVRTSLEQVLDHAVGRGRKVTLAHAPRAPAQADPFDVCTNDTLPMRPAPQRVTREAYHLAFEVVRPTPIPGLGPGLGAMPRFRAEVGPFIGVASATDARVTSGGFVSSVNSSGLIGGVDLALRAGIGLDGVIGESGDGLVFASVGLRGDTPSTNKAENIPAAQQGGTADAASPARVGISTRVRMPFYLIPGDLLLLSPMYFIAPEKYTQMAVTASNGGLIPWQSGFATRYGRFQFVLGRSLGATFYGYGFSNSVLAPSASPGFPAATVDFKSVFFDLPILEYRPYRAFDTQQSSAVLIQLFAGADVPFGERVTWPPGAPPVDLRTVYSLGLRIIFDWRRYF